MEKIEDQPAPEKNDGTDCWELVIQDMQERRQVGLERYGTPLQPFNGRNALVDAYQEVLDLAVYLRQKIKEENRGDRPSNSFRCPACQNIPGKPPSWIVQMMPGGTELVCLKCKLADLGIAQES